MAKQTILTGSTANDHSGDPLRTAFTKVNANFTELYTSQSNANTGNFTFLNDAISNPAGMLLNTTRGILAVGTDMEAPGVPNHFHIAFQNSNTQIIDKELFLGDDYNYIKVGQTNGVNIAAYDRVADLGNQKTWNFGNSGDLSLPVDGGIVFDRNNTSIRVGMGFHIASGEGISLEAIDQTDPDNLIYKGWYFNPDGSLTLPTNGTINYTPTTPTDWVSPAPTTTQEALDRLAAAIKTLNSVGS